jgi:toxin-antitoxin system PIN domain toxin
VSFAVDANVLLYASDEASPFHARAMDAIDEIASGPELTYLFWPVAMAYLRIATHPAVFARPMSHAAARANLDLLLQLPSVHAVGEDELFWSRFIEVADDVIPAGNLVPGVHLVALMVANGVRTIWTHDRDYRKFSGIRVHDPFA